MRILVVEDEKKVARFIKRGLEEAGYLVDTAADGEEGLYLAEIDDYDLMILDLILPRKGGLEVCQELRDQGIKTPVLILSARDSVEDKVTGLDLGADDYLTKPFAFSELLARVRALLRRGEAMVPVKLQVADLVMDTVTHTVTRAGKDIKLTSKEYALLEYFMMNPGKVLTRTMLSEHVWDYTFDTFSNVIDVYINYLRNKIDREFDRKLIHTVRGVGYVLKDEEAAEEEKEGGPLDSEEKSEPEETAAEKETAPDSPSTK
ncbi:MAG: response regulator transcription factor [bacterium]